MTPIGCFCLVLHSHIPYVLGHGTWPHGSEMLYEAAAETYLPLLRLIEQLAEEGISAKINISITPVVVEQLADERFKGWFASYLEHKVQVAMSNEDEWNWRNDRHLRWLAQMWRHHYEQLLFDFNERYRRNLVAAFRRLQDEGRIELMTSAATHGYLPLLREEGSIQAQVKQGIETYVRHFGCYPRGFWLPECAYRPQTMWGVPDQIEPPTGEVWWRKGLEQWLAENGIEYFIVDTPMLFQKGHPLAVRVCLSADDERLWEGIRRVPVPDEERWGKSPHTPYFVGDRFEDFPPIAIFTRDFNACFQVWDGKFGYPGDGWYLDFHKKHYPGALRYWRVTDSSGDLGSKQHYVPQRAQERVKENAGHFVWLIKQILRNEWRGFGRLPVVCCAFDAELFGHWWFEGIEFLGWVLRWLHASPEVKVMTCHEYLALNTPTSAVTLPEASWGLGGGHWNWLNEDTVWTWKRIYDAELDFQALIREYGDTQDPVLRGMIQQAGRELLLLQSSDWQFLISTWAARDYAEHRLHCHHQEFKRISEMARRYGRGEWLTEEDWAFYGSVCERDWLFPNLEIGWFWT